MFDNEVSNSKIPSVVDFIDFAFGKRTDLVLAFLDLARHTLRGTQGRAGKLLASLVIGLGLKADG